MATPTSFEFTEEELEGYRRRTSPTPVGREPFMVSEPPVFRVFSREDLEHLPQGNWLLRAVVPEARLMFLHGDSMAGKTLIALQWAFQMSRTDPDAGWWDQERIGGPYKVLYMAGEGQSGLHGRLRGIENVYGSDKDEPNNNLLFVTESEALNPKTSQGALALQDLVRRLKLDVVFIDTMRWYFDGEENDSTAVQQFLQTTQMMNKMGCAVVVVHHNRRSDQQMRGSSALFNAADTIIGADAETENGKFLSGRIKLDKQKDGPWWVPKFGLRDSYLPEGWREDEDIPVLVQAHEKPSTVGRDLKHEIKVHILEHGPIFKSKIAKAIGANSNDVSEVVEEMIEDEELFHTGNTRSPLDVVRNEVEEL